MLNRFLNQVAPSETTVGRKEGITEKDVQIISDLLESYTKEQLYTLSYKHKKDALSVHIQTKSPLEKVTSAIPEGVPLAPFVPIVQDADGAFVNWHTSEPQEEVLPVLESTLMGSGVRAHMSGSVYLKPSPTEADFVSLGKSVRAGDVLCLLEAMKLFSEVTAPRSGIITKIFVTHGSIVKEGDLLFEVTE